MTARPGMSAMLKAVAAAVNLVAAEEIMPHHMKAVDELLKDDGSLCTEVDLAAQESLTRKLQAILNVPVLGEEMSTDRQLEIWGDGLQTVWCIDPLDGTSNFVRGLPYFSVSVALFRAGKCALGVVYAPVTNEMFAAEYQRGAFLNGARLPERIVAGSLKDALAGVDMKRLDGRLAGSLASHPPYISQRNFGASTLDWCYTAAGRYDVYLHGGQKLWDYAAGCLVLLEAGGQVCSLEEDNFDAANVWRRSVVASLDAKLFDEWKNCLRARLSVPLLNI